jgi:hypothetical protein
VRKTNLRRPGEGLTALKWLVGGAEFAVDALPIN